MKSLGVLIVHDEDIVELSGGKLLTHRILCGNWIECVWVDRLRVDEERT